MSSLRQHRVRGDSLARATFIPPQPFMCALVLVLFANSYSQSSPSWTVAHIWDEQRAWALCGGPPQTSMSMRRATMTQGANLRLIFLTIISPLVTFRLCDYVEGVPWETSETDFCQTFVRSKGYLCEEHKLYTDDGFALLVHRVGKAPPTTRRKGSSGPIMGDIQSSLKVALSHGFRKRHESTITPDMKFTSLRHISGAAKDDLVSQRSQPFQSYDSVQGIPMDRGDAAVRRTRGGNARDSPENPVLPNQFFKPPIPRHGRERPFPPPSPTAPGHVPFTGYAPLPAIHKPRSSTDTPPTDRSPPDLPFVSGDMPGEIPGIMPEFIPLEAPTPSSSPSPSMQILEHPYSTVWRPTLGPSSVDSEALSPAQPSSIGPEIPDVEIPVVAPPPPINWRLARSPSFGAKPAEFPYQGFIKAPVLLLHHELLNGDSWFKEVSEDEASPMLPFLLTDEGFDVWVAHGRATYWGHDHLRLDSSQQEYWNWSWDEIAEHDMPALLVYIHQMTHSKIHVVGVSQSAAVAVATATQRPDVASLFASLVLVGPTIYHGSELPDEVQDWVAIFAQITEAVDTNSVTGQFNMSRGFGSHSFTVGGQASMITGPDCCISKSLTLFANGWDGTTSYKNFQHFEQGFIKNTFERFDYGSPALNEEVYGQSTAPAYSPANIPADLPVQIIYGGNDFFSSAAGVQELLIVTPRLPVTVYLPLYAHFDLLFSNTRDEDVYRPMLSFLRDPGAAI